MLQIKNTLGGGKINITNGTTVAYEARENIPKNTFVSLRSDDAKDIFSGSTVPCGFCEILPNKYLLLSNYSTSYASVRIYDVTETGLVMSKQVGYFFDYATCCRSFVDVRKISDGVAIAFIDMGDNYYTSAAIITVDEANNIGYSNLTSISASGYSGEYIGVCEIENGCYLVVPDSIYQAFKVTVSGNKNTISVSSPFSLGMKGKIRIFNVGNNNFMLVENYSATMKYMFVSVTKDSNITLVKDATSISSTSFVDSCWRGSIYHNGKLIVTGAVSTRAMHRAVVYDVDLSSFTVSNEVLTDIGLKFDYQDSSICVYGNYLMVAVSSGNSQYALVTMTVNDDKSITINDISDDFINETYTIKNTYRVNAININDKCCIFYRIYTTGLDNYIYMLMKGKAGIIISNKDIYGISFKNIPQGDTGEIVILN